MQQSNHLQRQHDPYIAHIDDWVHFDLIAVGFHAELSH